MSLKKLFWIILGCIGLGLGSIGVFLPILPSFPFLLLAAFSFARSSKRLHTWFINTNLYKKNLESYVQGKGMSIETKVRIILIVTLLMGVGITMMLLKEIYIPCIILFCVWIFHILYFVFGVKTLKNEMNQS